MNRSTIWGDQIAIEAVLMRGGTSRGIVVQRHALPADHAELVRVVCAMYGSPDVRQIDGVGGATSVTSKIAIVAPCPHGHADIDFMFGQVRIDAAEVDFSGGCGNMTAAVAAFAVDEAIVNIAAGAVAADIRIHLTNTDQFVSSHVAVSGGIYAVIGEQYIDGVPRPGGPIELNFASTSSTLGRGVLPLGGPRSLVELDGRAIEVSVVDVANPTVFVRAADVGMLGTELPSEISTETRRRLLDIRAQIAVRLGLVEDAWDAQLLSPAIPKVYAVAAPAAYRTLTGRDILPDEITILSRGMSMGEPHETHAATVSVCLASAAGIPGTIVAELQRSESDQNGSRRTRIGHPSGVITTTSVVGGSPTNPVVIEASIVSTARRLMSGNVFVPRTTVSDGAPPAITLPAEAMVGTSS